MISNDPFEKRRITPSYVWWKNLFSTSDLDTFESMCDKHDLTESAVVSDNAEVSDKRVRVSKIKFFLRNEETSWIFDRFNNVIQDINKNYYNFDLYGYSFFQYTVYDGTEKGKYDWHMDTILGNTLTDEMKIASTRKLTLVMLLNDRNVFSGGDFQINNGSEGQAQSIEMERGTIIAFPSFLIHRVTPVLSGVRKSIVIWVEGPKFR